MYEVDLQASELRKQGLRVKLQNQPFQILLLLLERPGQLVTRQELRNRLWPTDTFVDFDRGLNRAINRLREALHDDSDSPRYIETVPRRGYRFLAPIETTTGPRVPIETTGRGAPIGAHTSLAPPRTVHKRGWIWAALASGAAILLACVGLNFGGISERIMPTRRDAPAIRSLAVLPLQNLSNDSSQDYFAEGMTDELITEIAKISSLRVTSRTSIVQFRATRQPLPAIAKELGVEAIVEGTVLRAGGKVRITAQLIYAPEDRHLWSENYERDLGDVISIQRDVARAIAERIQVKLSSEERTALATNAGINPAAHESYLEASFFRNKGKEEFLNKSIGLFERAIQLDPSYAAAYAGLSQSYIMLGIFGFRPAGEAYPKAKQAALKALELDGNIAEAHTMLADVKKGYDWDWPGAETEYKRAIALNASYSLAHLWYAEYLSKMGRYDEAIAESTRGREIDPISPASNTNLCMVYYRARRYDQAITACEKTLGFDPNHASALWFLALAHEQKGDRAKAIRELEMAVQMEDVPLYHGLLGHAYALNHERSKALKELTELTLLSKSKYVSPVDVAVVYMGLGDRDSAFQWLEKAYRDRAMRIQELPDPMFDPLRGDPRFQDLLRRIGLQGNS